MSSTAYIYKTVVQCWAVA